MQEGATLLSALAAALSATRCPWPGCIPMHDPLRDAHWGVAPTASGATAFLDSDSVHISSPPAKLLRARLPLPRTLSHNHQLMTCPSVHQSVLCNGSDSTGAASWSVNITAFPFCGPVHRYKSLCVHPALYARLHVQVEGLLALFSQRLASRAPSAAAAVAAVAADTPLASMASAAAGRPPEAYALHVAVSERRTYAVLPPPLPGEMQNLVHVLVQLCYLMTDSQTPWTCKTGSDYMCLQTCKDLEIRNFRATIQCAGWLTIMLAFPAAGTDEDSEGELDWHEEWDSDEPWRPWACRATPSVRQALYRPPRCATLACMRPLNSS